MDYELHKIKIRKEKMELSKIEDDPPININSNQNMNNININQPLMNLDVKKRHSHT
jgi:hypothetical protein